MDHDVLQLVVTETNRYAEQQIDAMIADGRMKRHSRAKKWKDVEEDELKQFLALMFLTGVIKKPEIQQYWSTDAIMATPFFGKVIVLRRYGPSSILQIMRRLTQQTDSTK